MSLRGLISSCALFILITNTAWSYDNLKEDWPKGLGVWKDAHSYIFVFVTGFLNEGLPGYFDDNDKALREIGVPTDSLFKIELPSKNGPEKNILILDKKLREIKKGRRKQLVIFAHSKGAQEVLTWAIHNKDFVYDKVEQFYFIQGAFGGSPIADFIVGEGHPIDQKMQDRLEFSSHAYIQKLLSFFIGDGFESITTDNARYMRRQIKAALNEDLKKMKKMIYFITSKEKRENVSRIIQSSSSYLSAYYGKNDGLILERDQFIEDVGSRLLGLECDHLDAVFDSTMSNQNYFYRRNFTRTLIWHLLYGELP